MSTPRTHTRPHSRKYLENVQRPRERDAQGHYIPEKEAAMADLAAAAAQTPEAFAAEELQQSTRPDPRPDPPHELSSRERAAARAAEIMGHLDGALEDGVDELALDSIAVPDGWTYEWKRQTVYGKEDPAYDTKLARTGWESVPAERHPSMMPKGHRGQIVRDGLVLMERPKAITDRVKQIMYERARGAVRLKEQQLNEGPPGTFERVDERGRPMARVKTSHSPVEIPVPDA